MNSNNPRVCIIIPVYNGSDYLREAINSALAQTYENVRVLVVNDGSDDGGRTEEISLSYGEAIRYFRKENGGVASALNLGIREMRGEYVSWLSHDDVFHPDKIASQVSFLRTQNLPETILYGDYDLINAKSETVGAVDLVDPPKPEQMRFALTVRSPIHGCTTLIPLRCFELGGMFKEELRTTQDYELWFRFAGMFPFVHQPKRLIQSRHHEAQGTVTMKGLHMREVDELLSLFVQEMKPEELTAASGKRLSHAYAHIADNFRLRGCLSAAREARRLSLLNIDELYLLERYKLHTRLLVMEARGSRLLGCFQWRR